MVLHGSASFRFLQASQQGLSRSAFFHLVISCPHAGLSGSRVMVMAHSFEHAFAEQRRPEWRYIAYDVLRLGKKHLHAALVLNHGWLVDLQNSVEMKLHVISKWQHTISNLQWIAILHRISAYFISSWCWFTTCKDPSKHRQFISSIKRSKVLQLSGLFVARCDVVVFPHGLILHILGYKQCCVVNFL